MSLTQYQIDKAMIETYNLGIDKCVNYLRQLNLLMTQEKEKIPIPESEIMIPLSVVLESHKHTISAFEEMKTTLTAIKS